VSGNREVWVTAHTHMGYLNESQRAMVATFRDWQRKPGRSAAAERPFRPARKSQKKISNLRIETGGNRLGDAIVASIARGWSETGGGRDSVDVRSHRLRVVGAADPDQPGVDLDS